MLVSKTFCKERIIHKYNIIPKFGSHNNLIEIEYISDSKDDTYYKTPKN